MESEQKFGEQTKFLAASELDKAHIDHTATTFVTQVSWELYYFTCCLDVCAGALQWLVQQVTWHRYFCLFGCVICGHFLYKPHATCLISLPMLQLPDVLTKKIQIKLIS
jgi:hypothetical protein